MDLTNQPAAAQSVEAGDNRIQHLGREIMGIIYMLMRTVKIHEPDNNIFHKPLETLRDMANEVVEREGACSIEGVKATVYLNDHLLRIDAFKLDAVRYVIQEFQKHGMNGFKITHKVTVEELRGMTSIFMSDQKGEPDEEIMRRVGGIHVTKFQELREALKDESRVEIDGEYDQRRKFAVLSYARTVFFLSNYMIYLKGEGPPIHPSRAGRFLQNLADVCMKSRIMFLELTTIKNTNQYNTFHSVNTALLNMLMAVELQLSRENILDMGVAGLYHDLGRIFVPPKVLLKPGRLTPYERLEIEKVPVNTLKMLLRQRALNKSMLERLVAIYEHRVDFDKSLQDPQSFDIHVTAPQQSALSFFGRVLNITHTFESLTSPRPWREAMTPSEALEVMFDDMKGKFDPFLLRIFVKALISAGESEETGSEGDGNKPDNQTEKIA